MKSSNKNSKKDSDNKSTNNDSKSIYNMQKKIKDQAKRLISMQEYINTLESTLRENNNQSNNINEENSKNSEEKNKEIDIINPELKECLDFIKDKLIQQKEKEEKKGNFAYKEILEEQKQRIEALKRAIDIAKLMSNVTTDDVIELADKVLDYLKNTQI